MDFELNLEQFGIIWILDFLTVSYIIMLQKTIKPGKNIDVRPPVVVVLGHVDHGKSSLLEAIKDFKITSKESGGITQHIGAYEVEHSTQKITFIDTPGHEAFSAMRSRGAKTADIAILVVDACEGVKPQTKEVITYIKKFKIPAIVALNKMDRPEANPEKIKQELSQQDFLVESIGGKIPSVEISAKTNKGINELLELIILLAEMNETKGDISKPAEGVVIEAYLDKFRGPTSTLLIRDGILNLGDIIATRSTLGKIKTLENFQGNPIKKAIPSMPVIILGLDQVPQVGENFKVFPNIESAQKYVAKKERKTEAQKVLMIESDKRVLNIIIKSDVLGSIEAIEKVLQTLPQEKVILRILKSEPGEINENDVKLAQMAKAKIIGFRTKVNPMASSLAQRQKVKIKTFEVIYELVQTVRELMSKTIKTKLVRKELGKLKTLIVFRTEKSRQIIGGKVTEGEINKGNKIKIWRQEEEIGKGKIIQVQKNKKEVEKGIKGDEIGILQEGPVKIEEGDIVIAYEEERIKEEL